MEGREIYLKSYNEIEKMLKNNCTDKIEIDYTKFDTETKFELKKAIHNILTKRKLEVGEVIFKAEN